MKRIMVNTVVNRIETKRFSFIMDASMTKVASDIEREIKGFNNGTICNRSISVVEYLGSRKDVFVSDSLVGSSFVKESTGLITAMFDIKDIKNETDFDIQIMRIRKSIFDVFENFNELNVVEVYINEVPLEPHEIFMRG